MAKRYHNGKKISQGDYSGYHDRMAEEYRDSAMIHEDHSAIANLPQNMMIKSWPKVDDYMPEVLNDTISGIDRQMALDNNRRKAHFAPKKI